MQGEGQGVSGRVGRERGWGRQVAAAAVAAATAATKAAGPCRLPGHLQALALPWGLARGVREGGQGQRKGEEEEEGRKRGEGERV